VFLPFFALSGVEGRLLRPLGIAYIASLLASLVVALTVTPALCSLILPGSRAVVHEREPLIVRGLKRLFHPILSGTLQHPWSVLAACALLLVGVTATVPWLGQAFLPEFNEGALTISAVTMPGTSLAQSDELGRVVEKVIMAHPEVTGIARRTGRAELDEHAQGVESAELDVSYTLPPGRKKAVFLADLRQDLSMVPGMNITVGQPIAHRIDHMLSGSRSNVAVKIFGDNLYKLRALGEQVRRVMAEVPGVVDLATEPQVDIPTVEVKFDRASISRHGLTVEEVAAIVETAFRGRTVSQVLEGRYAFDLVLRLGDPMATDWAAIRNLAVDTPSGAKLPLHALAGIQPGTGPNQISRENVQRKYVVTCNVAGRDLHGIVDDIRRRVAERVPIGKGEYRGYYIVYGGQFESAEETTRLLTLLGIAVVMGIGLLLQVAFGSVRDALLVMVNLPLALVGGVLGVHLTGGIVTVGSLIGFITVLGIATRNGIMLVSHIRHLRDHEGIADLRESVERGAMERLAPILMTALATGLALVPLALGGDQPGNEIQTPMAVVILCGLLSSTTLNMLVLPTLYLRFRRDNSGVERDRSGQGTGQLQTVLAVDGTSSNGWDVTSGLVKTERPSN
jgi:CzcA family heavy metal efflux pump